MEARVKKYRQLSPERAKVWREPSKYQQIRRVQVVYYLCRNRQLEHPHVIEVPLSSTEGLYLRDVIDRLNVLRGRGVASMYSWSNKRSYKNGFVWHDLCEDDLILPSNGNEYVLKGSELFQEPNSARLPPVANSKLKNQKQLIEAASSSRSNDGSSSSSSLYGIERRKRSPSDDELSTPPAERSSSSPFEFLEESRKEGKSCSPWNGSLSLTEYNKTEGLANASTQTDENVGKANKSQETCTRGVSTDDGCLEPDSSNINSCQNQQIALPKQTSETQDSSSSVSSFDRKINTLESLIRADASTVSSFRIVEEEDFRVPSCAKLKASNILMQLISCGSIAVKDHSFGIIPTYKPRFSHTKFASPLFSTSLIRLKDKEYFSGSLVETCMLKEEDDRCSVLKRSASYNNDRSCNRESMGSADSEGPRESSEQGKVIKIEERLSSGARIIIQSRDVWATSVEED